MKPVPTNATRARDARNLLQGKIVSAASNRPEAGVEVVLSERRDRFMARTILTDAAGKFEVALPEGDWSIALTMPSGRTLAVDRGQITAASGMVTDMYGRELKNLVIQR